MKYDAEIHVFGGRCIPFRMNVREESGLTYTAIVPLTRANAHPILRPSKSSVFSAFIRLR